MAYETKPNTGAIFVNDKKESDKHPDRKGDANIECPHCRNTFMVWLSGWMKQTNAGKPMMSLAIKPKEARVDHQNERPKPRPSTRDDMQDEVPF